MDTLHKGTIRTSGRTKQDGRNFTTPLRMMHNLKLMNCLFLDISITENTANETMNKRELMRVQEYEEDTYEEKPIHKFQSIVFFEMYTVFSYLDI